MNWYKNIFRDKQQEQRILDLELKNDALKIDNKNLFNFLNHEEFVNKLLIAILLFSCFVHIIQILEYYLR